MFLKQEWSHICFIFQHFQVGNLLRRREGYHCICFTDEDTEVQGDKTALPKSPAGGGHLGLDTGPHGVWFL